MDLIGQMRQVVEFCLNAPVQAGAGQRDNYGILLTTRGRLKPLSAYREATSGEIQGDSGYELIVRYQQAIASTVSISSKWLIGGVFYTIHSWEKKDQETFLYYRFVLHKKDPPTQPIGSLLPIDTTGLTTLYIDGVTGNTIDIGVQPTEILLLSRSGLVWNKVASAPGDFQFSISGSVITFGGQAFNPGGEPVVVMYAQ